MSRRCDQSGDLIGTKHDFPGLDSRVYMIKFPDEHFKEYSANILAEALTLLNDTKEYDTGIIKELCGYLTGSSKGIKRKYGFLVNKNGSKTPKVTKNIVWAIDWDSKHT